MKTIGKIFLILFLFSGLFGKINSYVNKTHINSGDRITFTILSDSQNTIFPQITSINGYRVSTSSSSSYQNINSKVTIINARSYSFSPKESLTIPEYEVIVDNKKYKTKPIKITVSKPKQTLNSKFRFDIAVDKLEPYVNEEVVLTLSFKAPLQSNLTALNFETSQIKGFKVIDSNTNWQGKRVNNRVVYEKKYYLYPLKSGKITIPNLEVLAQVENINNGFFFSSNKIFKIYSNSIEINSKELPNNIDIVGNFSFKATVDKNTTTPNKAVNLTVQIKGEGLLEDIKDYNINIPNTTIYKDEPTILTKRINNKLLSTASYKFAIVSNNNYTIPSLSFRYFNTKLKKIVTLKTKPIKIIIKGATPKKQITKVQKLPTKQQNQTPTFKITSINYLYLILIFTVGVFTGLIVSKIKIRRKKPVNKIKLVDKIQSSKSQKELLNLIICYADKQVFCHYIKQLEKNNLSTKEFKEIKRAVTNLLSSKGVKV